MFPGSGEHILIVGNVLDAPAFLGQDAFQQFVDVSTGVNQQRGLCGGFIGALGGHAGLQEDQIDADQPSLAQVGRHLPRSGHDEERLSDDGRAKARRLR
jgi:hypothetical protein